LSPNLPFDGESISLDKDGAAWSRGDHMNSEIAMQRVALVTGGARGIGLAIARNLARDHDLAVTWLNTQPTALPDKVLAVRADLTDKDAAATIIAEIMDRFGRLDVIVNNAGLVQPSPIDVLNTEALGKMLNVNVLAAHALLAAALPHLQAGASIVNISSINAVLPPGGAAIYGASKAAINLWTKGMAKELGARQIRVNAVAPGAVNNPEAPRSDELVKLFADQTALGRIASPDDIARAVRFLAGDDASFITGEVLAVSGGYRL
jgi:3-oxoacyl-[acyl-carrier protein] reductase